MINWEYIDLVELRPLGSLETLTHDSDPQRLILTENFELKKVRKKPIRDILTWMQCFAVYIAATSRQFPEAVPEMLAYMLFIMKKAPEVEDQAWIVYDHAYREKAAATGNRKWSKTDSTLCDQIFGGRAKKLPLCTHCCSTDHDSPNCPGIKHTPVPHGGAGGEPEESKWQRNPPGKPLRQKWDRDGDKCRLFNADMCTYDACKYRHMCLICSGRHSAMHCPHSNTLQGRQVLERLAGLKRPKMASK